MGTQYNPDQLSSLSKLSSGKIMFVDEKKAKRIIKRLMKEGKEVKGAILGLEDDWNYNSCMIFDGEEFYEYDAWGGSIWATPTLEVDTSKGILKFECFK